MNTTIIDAITRKPITGKLVKKYPKGITIDDARGIRHYATLDRVITQPTINRAAIDHAPLF